MIRAGLIGGAIVWGALGLSACDDLTSPTTTTDGSTSEGGVADGQVQRDRFATRVVRFTPGECAGYGATQLPDVVLGPPDGGGDRQGGLDVLSLGTRGEIVLAFEPTVIVDGDGADFIVFENPFLIGGDPNQPNAELGEVSVSDDGVDWITFPCAPASKAPYGACAGWHPVYASREKPEISPFSPEAGGDRYDLADIGVTEARFVRIRDLGTVPCPASPSERTTSGGFDLDAIAIVHARTP